METVAQEWVVVVVEVGVVTERHTGLFVAVVWVLVAGALGLVAVVAVVAVVVGVSVVGRRATNVVGFVVAGVGV